MSHAPHKHHHARIQSFTNARHNEIAGVCVRTSSERTHNRTHDAGRSGAKIPASKVNLCVSRWWCPSVSLSDSLLLVALRSRSVCASTSFHRSVLVPVPVDVDVVVDVEVDVDVDVETPCECSRGVGMLLRLRLRNDDVYLPQSQ